MQVIKLYEIKDLAQNFLKAPKVEMFGQDGILIYDFEDEEGEYDLTGITFRNVKSNKHTKESSVERYMIDAYNSVAVVEDSVWLSEFQKDCTGERYQHFLVYFDGYGAYEFLAQSFVVGLNSYKEEMEQCDCKTS